MRILSENIGKNIEENKQEIQKWVQISVNMILTDFMEPKKIRNGVEYSELQYVKTLLEEVKNDVGIFNMVLMEIRKYVMKLDMNGFYNLKKRIALTIEQMTENEFEVLKDFLGGFTKFIFNLFFGKDTVVEMVTEYKYYKKKNGEIVDERGAFLNTLLGEEGETKDSEKLKEQLENAIKLIELMIQNRAPKEKQ